jgi:hypothetical protein
MYENKTRCYYVFYILGIAIYSFALEKANCYMRPLTFSLDIIVKFSKRFHWFLLLIFFQPPFLCGAVGHFKVENEKLGVSLVICYQISMINIIPSLYV